MKKTSIFNYIQSIPLIFNQITTLLWKQLFFLLIITKIGTNRTKKVSNYHVTTAKSQFQNQNQNQKKKKSNIQMRKNLGCCQRRRIIIGASKQSVEILLGQFDFIGGGGDGSGGGGGGAPVVVAGRRRRTGRALDAVVVQVMAQDHLGFVLDDSHQVTDQDARVQHVQEIRRRQIIHFCVKKIISTVTNRRISRLTNSMNYSSVYLLKLFKSFFQKWMN